MFREATTSCDRSALSLSKILPKRALGEEDRLEVLQGLKRCAKSSMVDGDEVHVEEYLKARIEWSRGIQDVTEKNEAKVNLAQFLENRGREAQSSDPPRNHLAAHFLDEAIRFYREIPRAEGPEYGIDQKITDLRSLMAEANLKSLDEMVTITSGSRDINAMSEWARQMVQGKSTPAALASFTKVVHPTRIEDLREAVEQSMLENPLSSIVPTVHLSSDGRVVAKTSGINPSMVLNEDSDTNSITSLMERRYTINVKAAAISLILPALEALRSEHEFTLANFVSLAQNSRMVPIGRERLVGRALYYGFRGDHGTSLYLLAPQLEHLVRVQLKYRDSTTTSLDEAGVEDESGLSKLVKDPELNNAFGEDVAFEIRSLFCKKLGPNLRNDVAHGLVDDDKGESPESVYAWWFFLRLVLDDQDTQLSGVQPK